VENGSLALPELCHGFANLLSYAVVGLPPTSVLVVTSAGAPSSAVVPVLAAIEAAGMRVRAIDIGGAGGGGSGVTDRVRRAILGEGAERKLRRELEHSPPDAAVAFDPHAALALTVARDQVPQPAPVIAVVGELEPAEAWALTAADRFLAVDDIAAVALADSGVEGERILVVGAIGERAFFEAGGLERRTLRERFKFGPQASLVLIEVAGLGAETTGQLALQLSLTESAASVAFLFDAGNDVDAASVLRRQVPGLGLTAKLFGTTNDAPLLWRVADVLVARPRSQAISRAQLVGGKLVALQLDGGTTLSAALERRGGVVVAPSLAMLSSAIEAAIRASAPEVMGDGADCVADIVAAIAADKRAMLDERRAALHAQTHARVKVASEAAQAAAAVAAIPGELEDLSGSIGSTPAGRVPDRAQLERLRSEVAQRSADMTKTMVAARAAAAELAEKAKAALARGELESAAQLDRLADAERARMHATLAELATLESELRALENAQAAVPPGSPHEGTRAGTKPASTASAGSRRSDSSPSIDDPLERLKRANSTAGKPSAPRSASRPAVDDLDHELAALKRKMGQSAPRKKP
jgi:hypothetical protein